jgi:hypothetical protein
MRLRCEPVSHADCFADPVAAPGADTNAAPIADAQTVTVSIAVPERKDTGRVGAEGRTSHPLESESGIIASGGVGGCRRVRFAELEDIFLYPDPKVYVRAPRAHMQIEATVTVFNPRVSEDETLAILDAVLLAAPAGYDTLAAILTGRRIEPGTGLHCLLSKKFRIPANAMQSIYYDGKAPSSPDSSMSSPDQAGTVVLRVIG